MREVDLSTEPNPDSVELMAFIDGLEPDWRALVHEYGVTIVEALMDEGQDAEQAAYELTVWRERRQEEWLATNFVRKREARAIAASYFRMAA